MRSFLARWIILANACAVLLVLPSTNWAADICNKGRRKHVPLQEEHGNPMGPSVYVERTADEWRQLWREAVTKEDEVNAMEWMFGGAPPIGHGPGHEPTAGDKKSLIERGLRYRFPETRKWALYRFPHLLKNEIDNLIPILNDGLGDKESTVRAEAATQCFRFCYGLDDDVELGAVNDQGTFVPLSLKKPQADAVVDLLVTKGIFDDNEEVRGIARTILDVSYFKPNQENLQSLQRAVHRAEAARTITAIEAEQLIAEWNVAVNGGVLEGDKKSQAQEKVKSPPAGENTPDPFE